MQNQDQSPNIPNQIQDYINRLRAEQALRPGIFNQIDLIPQRNQEQSQNLFGGWLPWEQRDQQAMENEENDLLGPIFQYHPMPPPAFPEQLEDENVYQYIPDEEQRNQPINIRDDRRMQEQRQIQPLHPIMPRQIDTRKVSNPFRLFTLKQDEMQFQDLNTIRKQDRIQMVKIYAMSMNKIVDIITQNVNFRKMNYFPNTKTVKGMDNFYQFIISTLNQIIVSIEPSITAFLSDWQQEYNGTQLRNYLNSDKVFIGGVIHIIRNNFLKIVPVYLQTEINQFFQILIRIIQKQTSRVDKYRSFQQEIVDHRQYLDSTYNEQVLPYLREQPIILAIFSNILKFRNSVINNTAAMISKGEPKANLQNYLTTLNYEALAKGITYVIRYIQFKQQQEQRHQDAFIFQGVFRYWMLKNEQPIPEMIGIQGVLNISLQQEIKNILRIFDIFDSRHAYQNLVFQGVQPATAVTVIKRFISTQELHQQSVPDFIKLLYSKQRYINLQFGRTNLNRVDHSNYLRAKYNNVVANFLFGSHYHYSIQTPYTYISFRYDLANQQEYLGVNDFPLKRVLMYQILQLMYRRQQVLQMLNFAVENQWDYQNLLQSQIRKLRVISFNLNLLLKGTLGDLRGKNYDTFMIKSQQSYQVSTINNWTQFNQLVTTIVQKIADIFVSDVRKWFQDKQAAYMPQSTGEQVNVVLCEIYYNRFVDMNLVSKIRGKWQDQPQAQRIIFRAYGLVNITKPWSFFTPQYHVLDSPQYRRFLARSEIDCCWRNILKYAESKHIQVTKRSYDKIQKLINQNNYIKAFKTICEQVGFRGLWLQKRQAFNQQSQSNQCVLLVGHHVTVSTLSVYQNNLDKVQTPYVIKNLTYVRQYQDISNVGGLKRIKKYKATYDQEYLIRRRSIFFDIQCLSGPRQYHQCFMLSYVGCWNNHEYQQTFTSFYGENPLERFAWLIKRKSLQFNYSQQDPLYISAFNGLGYDFIFLMKYLIKVFGRVTSFGHTTESKGYTINFGSIILRDLRLILTRGSLKDLCNEYQTEYRKMVFQIAGIDLMERAIQQKEIIQQYCLLDCKSLMSLTSKLYIDLALVVANITKTYMEFKNIEPAPSSKQLIFPRDYTQNTKMIGISLKQLYSQSTAPGIALLIYKRIFLEKCVKDNQPLNWKILQRKFYYGGICQVFRLWNRIGEKVLAYDINSSYPYSMTQPQPWDYVQNLSQEQISATNERRIPIQFLTFYYIEYFQFDINAFPFIGIRTKQHGLLYPYRSNCLVGVWGHTLSKCLYFKVISAARYQNGNNDSLRNYVNVIYPLKSHAKNKNQKNLYKLFINSLYGKLGQKALTQFQLISDMQTVIPKFQIGNMMDYEDYVQMQSKEAKIGIGQFVRVASYISSYSRYNLALAAQMAGMKNVFYCDTDSLYLNAIGAENIKSLVHEQQLGKWKKQGQYTNVLFVGLKYAILINKDKVQAKHKGISPQCAQLSNRDVAIRFHNQTKRELEELLKYHVKQLTKCQLSWPFMAKRWVRDRKKGSIVIEQYPRKTHFIPKRRFKKDGTSTPIEYNQE